MALSKEFKETVMTRAKRDSRFANSMLIEALNEFFSGDVEAGKSMLRDYINATVSFEFLAKILDKNPKSVMRMLGPNGNPTSKSLFAILHAIQKRKHMHIRISIS